MIRVLGNAGRELTKKIWKESQNVIEKVNKGEGIDMSM